MRLLPDMDSRTEMWMVVNLAGGLSRANEWVFLGVLALLVLYVIGRVLYEMSKYLFYMYRERAFTSSPHMQNFRILLGVGSIVLLVSFFLGFVAIGFALFSVASAVYDWYVSRNEQVETPELDGATLDDVVAWQQEVNAAYDTGLMVRSS